MGNNEVTAAALAMPRSQRIRLAAKLVEGEDGERAEDLEALACAAEIEEDPKRFAVSAASMKTFTRQLRAKYVKASRGGRIASTRANAKA